MVCLSTLKELRTKWPRNQALVLSSPAYTGTQNPSCVHSFFFCPTDRPCPLLSHLHEREGDGKRHILWGWPYPCTVVLPHSLLFLSLIRSATLVFVSFFVFPILPVISFKNSLATEKSSLRLRFLKAWARCETDWFFGGSRLTRRQTVVNFPCIDWLTSYLRTQLKAFVGGDCLGSRRFFLALLFRILVWSTHFNEF